MTMSDGLTTATQSPLPPAQGNLGYLFRLAFQRFRLALEEKLKEHGLSPQEYGLLSLFETRPQLSTSELARLAQVSRQTMHTAVLGLEASGLVERRATNPRVVLVAPTERGREHLQAATQQVRAVERAALAGLGADEERVIRDWLARLASTALDERRG